MSPELELKGDTAYSEGGLEVTGMRFEKLRSCLGKADNGLMGERGGKVFDFRGVFLFVTGLLLGLLLLGGSAEVKAQETNADGDLRLVNPDTNQVTSNSLWGRLEIFDDEDGDGNGEWKGICDDVKGLRSPKREVRSKEAKVACRQLGFSGGEPIIGLPAPKGAGTDDQTPLEYYLLDDLECSGSEPRILGENMCKHSPRGETNCGANEALGVTCEPKTLNNDAVGQVVINFTEPKVGVTATADHSGITDADGKPTDEKSFTYQWIRSNLDRNEEEIFAETHSIYTFEEADEDNWIKVRISFTDNAGNKEEVTSFRVGPIYANAEEGDLKLEHINDLPSEPRWRIGMVKIFDGELKRWSGICDDSWDDQDAQVACRQLDFSGGTATATAIQNISRIEYPPVLFLLDEVACQGTENTLLECEHAGRGVTDCGSWEYAGVSCAPE